MPRCYWWIYIHSENSQEIHDLGFLERIHFKDILKNGGKRVSAIISWSVESLGSTQGLLSAEYKSPE